jgi:hypothetical protein
VFILEDGSARYEGYTVGLTEFLNPPIHIADNIVSPVHHLLEVDLDIPE